MAKEIEVAPLLVKPLRDMNIRELKKLSGHYKVKEYARWSRMQLIKELEQYHKA